MFPIDLRMIWPSHNTIHRSVQESTYYVVYTNWQLQFLIFLLKSGTDTVIPENQRIKAILKLWLILIIF